MTDLKKYSDVITVDEQKAYVKILDKNNECLCEMIFDKNLLEQLGNRYEKDGIISKDSIEIDDIFFTLLMRVQEKFNLVESKKMNSENQSNEAIRLLKSEEKD